MIFEKNLKGGEKIQNERNLNKENVLEKEMPSKKKYKKRSKKTIWERIVGG